MGTRDLLVALVITIGFIILVNTLFNENSRFSILPSINDISITKEEYLDIVKSPCEYCGIIQEKGYLC